jgi:hypothetical protein
VTRHIKIEKKSKFSEHHNLIIRQKEKEKKERIFFDYINMACCSRKKTDGKEPQSNSMLRKRLFMFTFY